MKKPFEGVRRFFENSGYVYGAVFLFLLIFNLDRVLDPPYWDGITGVYSQGLWLADNGFDYIGLMNQPNYYMGGPKVNYYLLLAPLYGALIKCLSPQATFLFLHLLNLFCASAIATVFFVILKSYLPAGTALLWTAAGMFNPIWSGQAAGIYLEIPFAAFLSLSLFCYWKGNIKKGAVLCVFSYFLKPAALLLSLSLFFSGVILLFSGRIRWRDTIHYSWPLSFISFLNMFDANYFSVSYDCVGMVKHFFGRAPYFFWDIPVLLVVAALLITGWLFGYRKNSLHDFFDQKNSLILLLSVFVFGFWASYIIYANPLVRYMVMIVFPLFAVIALILSKTPRLCAGLAFAVLTFGLVNQEGILLKDFPPDRARSGHLLERSREYLKDLDGNRRFCRFLETKFFDAPIVVKYPFTQMLTRPELGYVKKSLSNIIGAGRFPYYFNATSFPALVSQKKDFSTLCIYSPNIFEGSEPPSLKPASGERVFYEENSLRPPNQLFVRHWKHRQSD